MSDRPPLLPVLVGVGCIGLGLVNGLFFTSWALVAQLSRLEVDPAFGPGLLALIAVFALLLAVAGVGVLLHRRWGKALAEGAAFGTTFAAMLGVGVGVLGIGARPGLVLAASFWGLLTGLTWAIALNLAARHRSMRAAFGEGATDDAAPGR